MRRFDLAVLLALLVGGAALHATNHRLEDFRTERIESGEVGPLPDGEVLRVLSLGFERLIADLYWIRTVFYVGGPEAQAANYPSAGPLAHLVTDIDPAYDSVYVLMSSVLGGLRGNPEEAIELLEKGARYSDYWRIYFLLGFNYFMELGDHLEGARWLQEAAKRGGPPYLPLLVSRLYTHGGDPETAAVFLQERLRNEPHPEVREKLERRLQDVLINRDVRRIDRAIARYAQLRAEVPTSIAQLVEAGLVPPELVDPTGKPYRIVDGHADSQTPFELLKLRESGPPVHVQKRER